MAAVGIAIIGRNNEPLYVREFLSEHETENGEDDAMLFGLKPLSTGSTQAASSKCWFALHAALDRLEQLTKTMDGKKKPLKGDKHKNFVGLLLPFEETRIYGYLTNSQNKILVLMEDEGPNFAADTESDAKQLLEETHELYIQEVMNPFHRHSDNTASPSNKLSQKFDESIQKSIANFNQAEIRYNNTGSAEC